MPIVAAALMLCEGPGCKAREVVALMRGPNGASAAEPPPGWQCRVRSVVVQGQAQVECLCPSCKTQPIDAAIDRINATLDDQRSECGGSGCAGCIACRS